MTGMQPCMAVGVAPSSRVKSTLRGHSAFAPGMALPAPHRTFAPVKRKSPERRATDAAATILFQLTQFPRLVMRSSPQFAFQKLVCPTVGESGGDGVVVSAIVP